MILAAIFIVLLSTGGTPGWSSQTLSFCGIWVIYHWLT